MIHWKKTIKYSLLLVIGFSFLGACEETEEQDEIIRLFRPVNPEIKSSGTWISAEWDKIRGAVSYTAEISTDSFLTSYATTEVDTSYVVFENLDEVTTYFFRLKANAEDPELSSHWSWLGKIFIGRIPSILKPQDLKDATATTLTIRWEAEDTIPTRLKIELNSDGTLIKEVNLTEEDVQASYKEITELTPATVYKITIYSGERSLGYELYMTLPS